MNIYIYTFTIHVKEGKNKILRFLTWAGAAIRPTPKPNTTLPTKRQGIFVEKPMMNHPTDSGTAENCKAPRLPIPSNNGPDIKDPIGVAKLWTDAER